jgi:ornithine cyclodeaminase/alanine dehydrogenase-like protein (mu-crystallin family)
VPGTVPAVLRYLSEADVEQLAPRPAEAVALARRALVALARGQAELPPKPAVHPRGGAFANAMPAFVADGDLLGLKWVCVFPANAAVGEPAINGLVLLSDAVTGTSRAILGAGALTAVRTAGVSGACIQALAPARRGHLAITGAGVQARSHLRVAAALGVERAVVHARRGVSGEALVTWAAVHVPELRVECTRSAERAVRGAAVVVTAIPIGAPDGGLDPDWIEPDALLLPLDYGTSVRADLGTSGSLYADDVGQFLRYREAGSFPDYPDPLGPTGAALEAPRPAGRVVCQNLGNGAADLVLADAVVRAAEDAGAGVLLER